MLQYIFLSLFLLACQANVEQAPALVGEQNPEQKKYWYGGAAEISSYKLSQARYGENHPGHAVLVFVTEPFSAKKNTKSDNASKDDVSVLKLNYTKKFNTGIYPYSMMTSTFFPFENGKHSLKVSSSSQEWCGHTYMELRNKKDFEVQIASYFEGESKENIRIKKALLEDDLWSMIRLSPDKLPIGKHAVIPSFFYLRLRHQTAQAYECEMQLTQKDKQSKRYSIHYPELNRRVEIDFENKFPYKILGWTETYESGFGPDKKQLKSSATLIKSIKSAYWNKHDLKDAGMRKELGL